MSTSSNNVFPLRGDQERVEQAFSDFVELTFRDLLFSYEESDTQPPKQLLPGVDNQVLLLASDDVGDDRVAWITLRRDDQGTKPITIIGNDKASLGRFHTEAQAKTMFSHNANILKTHTASARTNDINSIQRGTGIPNAANWLIPDLNFPGVSIPTSDEQRQHYKKEVPLTNFWVLDAVPGETPQIVAIFQLDMMTPPDMASNWFMYNEANGVALPAPDGEVIFRISPGGHYRHPMLIPSSMNGNPNGNRNQNRNRYGNGTGNGNVYGYGHEESSFDGNHEDGNGDENENENGNGGSSFDDRPVLNGNRVID